MDRFIPEGGIYPDTIQSEAAEALAVYLSNAGLDEGMCLPTAIGFLGIVQRALDADDLSVVKASVRQQAIDYNRWLTEHYPHFQPHVVIGD